MKSQRSENEKKQVSVERALMENFQKPQYYIPIAVNKEETCIKTEFGIESFNIWK